MKSISPKAKFRQLVIKYSQKRGVTAASIRYRVCRKAIYDWKKRYDGRWQSLIDRSHRPHSHPRQQTAEEYAMIERYYRRTKDKIMLWDKLRENGYTRCYNSLLRAIKRLKLEETPEKRKGYKPKPYQRAEYPGQKVQIDVKFVPAYCVANGQKYYQYTAVDECTKYCFREMYDEHSTYSSLDFLKKLIVKFPFPIREVQTDNGTEWTNVLLVKKATHKTLFEEYLEECGIKYHRIQVATPRHNGKVERQHRLDEQRFYSKMRMFSLEDGRKQLAKYNRISNNISKSCLKYRSPNAVLADYLAVM
ncbi:MAG: transposase [Clostridia bacterium]|nr:transposase [Clostridia bacterium]